uniref:Uncharacterized protein n=1 Tax=Coccolithus braarudii TaxID=221442 RepID=A0A7S0LVD7_9EUKA
MFALSVLQKVHAKHAAQGKVTFELSRGKGSLFSMFVSNADPKELKALLATIEEAAQLSRQQNSPLSHSDALALLHKRFPEQMKKQLAAMRQAAQRDAPVILKGRSRLMITFDAGDATPSVAGKAVCQIAHETHGLRMSERKSLCNAQAFHAVGKNADKKLALSFCVRVCAHAKFKRPLWLDLDVGEGVDAAALQEAIVASLSPADSSRSCSVTRLAHGGFKERLSGGLYVLLRSGVVGGEPVGQFATRIELRAEGAQFEGAAPLGKCELRYSEEESGVASPIVVLMQMHKEACAGWGIDHAQSRAALAVTLVSRVEVFVSRLAASSSGTSIRPKMLVAGWLPQVSTAPFEERGFRFDGGKGAAGFKLLQTDAERARKVAEAVQKPKRKREDLAADAEKTPHRPPDAACERDAREGGGDAEVDSALTTPSAASGPTVGSHSARSVPSSGESPRTRRVLEATHDVATEADESLVLELGEVSQLGRVKMCEAQPPSAGTTAAPAVSTEGMDEVDATIAELLA